MVSTAIFIVSLAGFGFLVWLITKLLVSQKQHELSAELKVAQSQNSELKSTYDDMAQTNRTNASIITELEKKSTELQTLLTEQAKNQKEQEELHKTTKEQMKLEFEALAQRIFEEKSQTFKTQNKETLDLVINPFKEQLKDFKKKVEDVYGDERTQIINLKEKIDELNKSSVTLSLEADKLAKALKSDTKMQGDWGEINLVRILDLAGLQEGKHYFAQAVYKNEAGENLRPDIVVNLPEDKQIIIDSKVSLVGYDKYYNATDEAGRKAGAGDLVTSIRRHIAELDSKNYENLPGINTLDFVLMFIPIEGAYIVAVNEDTDLYRFASQKKVLLVCPSTLLITMQLVYSLWRIDTQKRNVSQIAEQGEKLYSKFVNFIKSMLEIKKHLLQSMEAYDKAHSQLTAGRGNIITHTQKLIKLGVKAKEQIPEQLLLEADELDDFNNPDKIDDNGQNEILASETSTEPNS